MLTASPITNQPVGKTFSIAIGTLGVGAALQVVLIGWALVHRPPVVAVATPVAVASPVAHVTEQGTAPAPATTFASLNTNPFAEPPQTQVTPATPALPPKPTPVTHETAATAPANRFEELIFQAKQLRERGDMNAAITKFREAGTLDAKSPIPLYELAATYEKMGLADKAAEHWRKVYEMGANAGDIYYSVAEAKLKAAQATDLQHATTTPSAGEAVSTAEAHNSVAAGAVLGLGQITTEEQRDDNSAKHFVLHIPIEARPKARIDVRDLVIHVLFYDVLDGQNVVVTSADVQSHWATPPADWVDSDTEELAVEYKLPKPEARGAKRENRKYFGYIVRIYYKQQLQAAAADPVRLAQQYPPPPTLPKENDK